MSETADAYSMTISENSGTCYIKLKSELEKIDQEEMEKLQGLISEHSETIINYIFDLSQLTFISNKCHRSLALAQHHARSRSGTIVVTVAPKASLKKTLLEAGIIRPKEVCSSLDKVGAFVKHLRQKM